MWIENMSFSVTCICVLCLNLIQIGQQQVLTDPIPTDNVGYQFQQLFYPPNLTRKLTAEFMDLLKLINAPQFSAPSIRIKYEIENLILNNQIKVAKVMNYANTFKGISNIDRMIVALLALRDTFPNSCNLKKKLRQLILYSIFNKDKISSVVHPYEEICQEAMLFNQNKHCRNLCQNLKLLPNTCSSIPQQQSNSHHWNFFDMPLQSMRIIKNPIETKNATNIYMPNQVKKLIELLPIAKDEEEQEKYNIIKNFFESQEISEYLQSLNHTEINKKTLKNVLEYATHMNVSESIRQAVDYYLNYEENTTENPRKNYDFASLISSLPEPQNEDEKIYYNTAVSFLNSSKIHELCKSIDILLITDIKMLYKTVIELLSESKELDEEILKAFKFYADYEDYADLEFSTRKVIFKSFRLLKMFKEVIDKELLDQSTSDKLKIFLRYISQNARILLIDFEIPSHVHTRAELIMAILDYLLSHPDVPFHIKDIIQILSQHVIFTGEGAVSI